MYSGDMIVNLMGIDEKAMPDGILVKRLSEPATSRVETRITRSTET